MNVEPDPEDRDASVDEPGRGRRRPLLVAASAALAVAGLAVAGTWTARSDPTDSVVESASTATSESSPAPAGVSMTEVPSVGEDLAPLADGVGPTVEPELVYDGPIEIVAPETVIDGVRVEGCLRVRADDVVIRNSVIECPGPFPIDVRGVTGFVIERSRVTCTVDAWQAIFILSAQFTVSGNEVRNCDDPLYVDGSVGESAVIGNLMWKGQLGVDSHFDGIQIGSTDPATGSLLVEGNRFVADGEGCCYNAAVFVSAGSIEVTMRDNVIDGAFGTYLIRCYEDSRCVVEGNVVDEIIDAFVLVASTEPLVARCNVVADGSPIPETAYVLDGGILDLQQC